jgi:diguanylate cyclase (GGDEF)-like protein
MKAKPPSESLLDTAVALTEKRDLPALAGALVAGLAGLAHAQTIRLLAISNPGKDTEFDDANIDRAMVRDVLDPQAPAQLIAEDSDLLFCVRSQHAVSRDTPPHGRRLVLPLYGVRHIMALLVLEGLTDLGVSEAQLAKLLAVYSNQAFLLARNERDALTGLYNRQSFDERLKRVAAASGHANRRAGGGPALQRHCFALVDIDHFKQVNDTYGHLYGDEVLLLLSRLMTRTFRQDDLLFRYGGEEFAIVLATVEPQVAATVLERFRTVVEAYEFPQIGRKTVSVGVAEITGDDAAHVVVERADKALYYAKEHGRNRVCSYEQLVASGEITPVAVAAGDVELF